MTAFKCDICGAYYMPYNYFANQDRSIANAITLNNTNGGVDRKFVKSFDVCPECMKAFEKLLEERKRHGPSIGGD